MMPRSVAVLLVVALGSVGCGSDTDAPSTHADTGQITDADAGVDADAAEDTGVNDGGLEIPERPWPVDQPGPYNVGFTQREVTYEARGADEPRTLRLAIWYPTRDRSGRGSAYYERIPRDEAFAEATVGIEEPAPLLVFSHGNGSLAEQSYFMTEFFASHGWIVVAPDHTGNTLADTQGAIDLTSGVFRPQDISAVLDDVLALPGDDPLSGLISEEHIAMSGHSFGGFTTLANAGSEFVVDQLVAQCEGNGHSSDMCDIVGDRDDWLDVLRDGFDDPRIKVAIPQAPGGYEAFGQGLSAIDTPTLLFTGGADRTLPNDEEGDPIWQTMQGSQHIRLNLPRAGHFTFSNMCTLVVGIDEFDNDGCSSEFIAADKAFEIINAYSLAFARYHLLDDTTDADLIDGSTQPYDGVEFSRKAGQ